jgi:hypothetical protein
LLRSESVSGGTECCIPAIYETALSGETVAEYPEVQPYPSVLVFGRTDHGRPIHAVFAYDGDDGRVVVVTVYQPDPDLWVDYRRRNQ